MTNDEALALVADQSASAELLASLVGQSLEVDRQVASHPNATPAVLEVLMDRQNDDGGRDVEIARRIMRNANVSLYAFGELAHVHKAEAIHNPAFEALVDQDGDMLHYMSDLLERPDCPKFFMDLAINDGSPPLLFSLMRNSALSEELRRRLNSEVFIEEAAAKLQAFQAAQANDDFGRYVQAYAELCNPQRYSLPVYLPFDPKNPEHRLADQVICGHPFTSEAWPWPKDSGGDAMQPVAQIDLVRAGISLDEKLGDGLLQVWMSTDPDSDKPGSWEPLLRVVPRSALSDPMDEVAPDGSSWNAERIDYVSSECLCYLGRELVPSARVEWLPAGKMYPDPGKVMYEWCDKNTSFGDVQMDEVSAQVSEIGLPMASSVFLGSKTDAIRLGGYPRGSGNEGDLGNWLGNPERILFYVSEQTGTFCLVVTYRQEAGQFPVFRTRLSVDR